jgi:hypothetical protein
MTLVRIVKDWDWPNLMRQTPGQTGAWEGIKFTLEPVDECDFLIVLNYMCKRVRVRCPREHVWAMMQEPYIKGFSNWMVEGHEYFAKVFTHFLPSHDPKYVVSHPALPWHVNRSFDELASAWIPEKSKTISWITSDKSFFPGHKRRMVFLQFIQNKAPFEIDIFGRGIRPIEDKWDGLAPYKYSLAVENSRGFDYWTEKVADCFLTWTVPFYYGCLNLEAYFPPASFIRIDIQQPEASLDTIKKTIKKGEWEDRLPALAEARNLVLSRYQLFPFVSEMIRSQSLGRSQKTGIKIPAYSSKKWVRAYNYLAYKKLNGGPTF